MPETDLAKIKAAKVIDERGISCPEPLIVTKQALVTIPIGAILEVRATDPTAPREIPIWARDAGQECLGVVKSNDYFRIFIRRKK